MEPYTISELLAQIAARIFGNHEQAITGEDLQEMLVDIVNALKNYADNLTVSSGLNSYVIAGSQVLAIGENQITFPAALPESSQYIVLKSILATDGSEIGGILSDNQISGFKITVSEISTIYYHVIKIS
jgi:hypothetical protein